MGLNGCDVVHANVSEDDVAQREDQVFAPRWFRVGDGLSERAEQCATELEHRDSRLSTVRIGVVSEAIVECALEAKWPCRMQGNM